MRQALGEIQRTLGVDLAALPMTLDDAFVEDVRRQVAELPKNDLRILLLSNSAMKFHERTFLLFFNALGRERLKRCDCVAFDADGRSFHPELRNVRYVSAAEARQPDVYDAVISFDSNQKLPSFGDATGARAVHVGRTRFNLSSEPARAAPAPRGALARLLHPFVRRRPATIRVYSTLRSTLSDEDFLEGLSERPIDYRSDIDLPPNIDTYFKTPKKACIPYLALGGGDRDYGFLLENRDLFDAPVLVTSAEARPGRGEEAERQNRIIEELRRDPKFVCVSYLDPELYVRAIVHSRVVVIPVTGEVHTDYTSVADAIWYGKPVLTNLVRANAHLADRVSFYSDAHDLRVKLDLLRDEAFYEASQKTTRARARANHSLHGLLLAMYREL